MHRTTKNGPIMKNGGTPNVSSVEAVKPQTRERERDGQEGGGSARALGELRSLVTAPALLGGGWTGRIGFQEAGVKRK